MKKYIPFLTAVASVAFISLFGVDAFAQSGDVVSSGNGLILFISSKLGPIVLGLGLVMGAGSLILGIPGAVQKLTGVVVGGILLTSIDPVVRVIQGF